MAIIKQAQDSFLGIDLGMDSIKIVELKNEGGRARLVTYGYTDEILKVPQNGFLSDPNNAVKMINSVCKKARTISNRVIAALPVSSIFSSIISLHNVPLKDVKKPKNLASFVQWEAKKIIPMPIEEMVLDWKILNYKQAVETPAEGAPVPKEKQKAPEEEEKIKTLPILLTAAPKNLVNNYIDIFKKCKFILLSLETESFAMVRSLVGNDTSVIMLVDIGSVNTDISIIKEGIPYLTRSINIGGNTITRKLSENLNIGIEEAEQLKKDIGIVMDSDSSTQRLMENLLSPIINEIRYCFDVFKSQEGFTGNVEKIILSGGGALLPNLPEYFMQQTRLRAYIGDPWARVIYPSELKPVLDNIATKFSVPVGLAMREIE